jgi:beta-phosphoglucomutase-like phosphatase (HAD superfamily)
VAETKPAPEVYLCVVEEMGIPKANCLAVEDSATGVTSAKAAGLRVVAVPNRYTRRQDLSQADMEVESLERVLPIVLNGRL